MKHTNEKNRILVYFILAVYTVYAMLLIVSAQQNSLPSDKVTPDMFMRESDGSVYRVNALEVMRQQCFPTNPLDQFQKDEVIGNGDYN